MTFTEIEQLTRKYADAREELGDLIRAMEDNIEQIKRANLSRIKDLVSITAEREDKLRAAVELSPDLFTRPRTVIFHGIKVGFQKGKGILDIPDPARTVELIKKHFPGLADVYIRIKETPDKEGLLNLSAAELKKIGCTVTQTGDQVVIRAVNGELDKIVNALLKEAADLEAAAKN